MQNTVQGFILIDVDVAALNNAGRDSSTRLENAVSTKKIAKASGTHAYVSGQAWRYWWRETLKTNFGWTMSPVVREAKVAFTAANPVVYPDDDLFGYMRAAKEETGDDGKKKKSVNVTLTRVSPLKNSALLSVSPNRIAQHWSAMTRQQDDSVPFGKDEYCATMKGMFSISIEQVGTFSSEQRSGFKNLNDALKKLAIEKEASAIDDPFTKGKDGNPLKLFRLPREVRARRITDAISALEILNGGAMQTCNLADVTPKLIVLTTLNSGNHIFSHLAKDDLGKPTFSVDALRQVVGDYSERIVGNVYIGRRAGFMDELEEKIQEFTTNNGVFYGSVNEAIRGYVKELQNQIP